MASFIITTTEEEQAKVMQALSVLGTEVLPVSRIASEAGLGQTRTRYTLEDLIAAGKIERIPTKAFNKHYVRYRYKITHL